MARFLHTHKLIVNTLTQKTSGSHWFVAPTHSHSNSYSCSCSLCIISYVMIMIALHFVWCEQLWLCYSSSHMNECLGCVWYLSFSVVLVIAFGCSHNKSSKSNKTTRRKNIKQSHFVEYRWLLRISNVWNANIIRPVYVNSFVFRSFFVLYFVWKETEKN